MYDGAVRDRASVNVDNVSEKNYKTFSPDLSEDSEIIETQADLATEASKTYESVTIDESHLLTLSTLGFLVANRRIINR